MEHLCWFCAGDKDEAPKLMKIMEVDLYWRKGHVLFYCPLHFKYKLKRLLD